jgi:small subunit ribosomal protein S9
MEKAKTEKRNKKEKASPKEEVEKPMAKEKYFEAVGRRKTAIARVRLFPEGLRAPHRPPAEAGPLEKSFIINDKNLENYFPIFELQQIAKSVLEKMNCLDRFRILVKVKGGGLHSQAEAIRLGLSRSLILFNPNFVKRLKKFNYLTRDPRMKERKKFGLKRARRAPQWQKR